MAVVASRYRGMLTTYLAPQRAAVALLAALLLGRTGLLVVNPRILRAFIDSATGGTAGQGASSLTGLAALFIVAALVQQALAVGATYVSETVGWTATNALRADLARHCLRLDLSFHKARTPGELIERVDGDVTAVATFFTQLVIMVLGNLLLLVAVLAALWWEDWRVGLGLTVFALAVLAIMLRVRLVGIPYWAAARQASAALFGFLEERLAGIEDIRSCGAAPYIMRRLAGYTGERLRAERVARLVSGVVWSVPIFAFSLGTAGAFVLSASLVGAGAMTIGTAFLVYSYTQLIFRPLNQISNQMQEFQKATAGIVRIQEVLRTPSALLDGPGARFPAGPLSVAFDRVDFGYGEAELVVRDLDFQLAPGRVLGLLGRTGSGKTTLTRLLFRLYDPAAGAVRLGGVDLRAARLAEARRQIGLVTQDVQLFRASVRDNLTFFDRSVDDARIWAALEQLDLADWCWGLPDGLDTVIAAGGLSAGEAQLLAFARVFLRDPGLVILDEASSRLDPATEARIERAVDALLRGRTAIIVAHRLGTIERADEVMILDAGRIVEHGSRPALAADPGSRFAGLLRTGLEEVLA